MSGKARRWSLPQIPLPGDWEVHVEAGVVHAIGLAHFAMVHVASLCADSRAARLRLVGEAERLRAEIAMLREEIRIKDARIAQVEPARRPHYRPEERLAILQLKAARAWSAAQAASRFLVSAMTIASWMRRLEADPTELLRLPVPVNRFSDWVGHVVQSLRAVAPAMGKVRIAQLLARAGMHLGVSTVARMLAHRARSGPPPGRGVAPTSPSKPDVTGRTVTAKRPNHVWNIDLTQAPTSEGQWAPWWPFSLAPTCPQAWWIAAVLDHFSRRVIGFALFRKQPTEAEVCAVLERAVTRAGCAPKYTVTDQGVQFRSGFRAWCAKHGIRPRFGAIGRHGSIAVTERFFLTLKSELLRKILVPLRLATMRELLTRYIGWYNEARPHRFLGGATPCEVYDGVMAANRAARFEPRARYPAMSPCAAPPAKVRGRPGVKLRLVVDGFAGGDPQLMSIVHLRRAA